MNCYFQTFLKLLLAISITATPVSISLANPDINSKFQVHTMDADPCDQMKRDDTQTIDDSQISAACPDCDNDRTCMDTTECCHISIHFPSILTNLPGFFLKQHDAVPVTIQSAYISFNPPTDSPTPIA